LDVKQFVRQVVGEVVKEVVTNPKLRKVVDELDTLARDTVYDAVRIVKRGLSKDDVERK
jgi:hypothetical protein